MSSNDATPDADDSSCLVLEHNSEKFHVEKNRIVRKSEIFTDRFLAQTNMIRIKDDYSSAAIPPFIAFLTGEAVHVGDDVAKDLYFLSYEFGFTDFNDDILARVKRGAIGNRLIEMLDLSSKLKVSPPAFEDLVSAQITSLSELPSFCNLQYSLIDALVERHFAKFEDSTLVEIASRLYVKIGEKALELLKRANLNCCDRIALNSLLNVLDPNSVAFRFMDALINEKVMREKAEEAADEYIEAMDSAYADDWSSANYLLGKLYLYGRGMPKRPEIAFERFSKAASENHPKACMRVGMLYQEGLGVERNVKQAAKFYKKAVKLGDEEVKLKVTNRIISDFEMYEAAEPIIAMCGPTIEEMVDDGWPEALFAYAVLSRDGIGVKRDLLESVQYFLKAEANGHPNCDVEIKKICMLEATEEKAAEMYERGLRAKQGEEPEKAAECFKYAADAGHALAMCAYAGMLREGEGCDQSYSESAKYFKMAADIGQPHGQCNYGFCLLTGTGVEKNEELAVKYFKMSADGSDVGGFINYGSALRLGRGVSQDLEAAAKYLKMAAESGNALGQALYAQMLRNGEGVEKNSAEAAKYTEAAAESGNTIALLDLGDILISGEGIEKNPERAAAAYKQAADNGDKVGNRKYGLMRYNGEGVERDEEEGIRYLEVAADSGDSESCSALAKLLKDGDKADMYRKRAIELGADEEQKRV